MNESHVDPTRCPLCGNPNDCGLAAGKGNCWCFTRSIPAEVLKRVPAEAYNIACVCRFCGKSQHALTRVLGQLTDLLRRHR
jgi:hypothetical protein